MIPEQNRMKWAFFIDGMVMDPDTLDKASLGGSETAGIQLCRALAERGHEVNLFCRCTKDGIFGGVRFHNLARYMPWVTTIAHDIAVVQRIPHPFQTPTQGKVHFFWMHDLALRRYADPMRGNMWNVDRLFVLSEMMKKQYMQVYGLPDDVFYVTRNGIDHCLIDDVEEQKRDPKLVIYTARPERGMDLLLEEVFPRLLKADPEVRLILSGYDHYVDHLRPLYQKCEYLINRYAGRVRHVGALTKAELYKLYKTAMVYVYPSNFEEISCITAMELMASGTPMVGSALGALPETLPRSCGTLVQWKEEKKGAHDEEYQIRFTEAVLFLLRNPKAWEQMSLAGIRHAKALGWDGVAEDWEGLALQLREET